MMLCLVACLILQGVAFATNVGNVTPAVITVEPTVFGRHPVEGFVSFNFDWHKNDEESPLWVNMSAQLIDLTNPYLVSTAKTFAPAHLRIGGSQGDIMVYNVDGQGCDKWAFNPPTDPAFCLNMSRWHELTSFASSTGLRLVFGLNAMNRVNDSSPSNFTNIEAFLQYTHDSNIPVYGFEFGNELPKVDPKVMGQDYVTLRQIINNIWGNVPNRPKLIGNDMNPDAGYLPDFFTVAGSSMDVFTYHNYVGYGLDPNLANEILQVDTLNENWARASPLQEAQVKYAPHLDIWVGEVAAAWHSGRQNVTNAFVGVFWYIDQLSTTSTHNHSAFCRQTLLGGGYSLLNILTYSPNPDAFAAYVWKSLVGSVAFHPSNTARGNVTQGTYTLRNAAYCSQKHSGGIVLALVNIDRSHTFQLNVEGFNVGQYREDYVLHADALDSRTIKLNGETMALKAETAAYPDLVPVVESVSPDVITIAPLTIGFYDFPTVDEYVCRH